MTSPTRIPRRPIRTTPRSRLVAIGAALLGSVALAACSSGSSPSHASGDGRPTGSSTSTVASAPVASTPDAPTSSGPGTGNAPPAASTDHAPAACAETQLRASVDPRHIPGNGTRDPQGRLTHGVLIDFRNTSSATCGLYGYPGVAVEDAGNHQLRQATRTLRGALGGLPSTQSAPTTVVLTPGSYAAAMIEGVDQKEQGAAQAGCDDTTPRILVTPPNTEIPVPFTVTWGVCFSLDVHPVRALPSAP